MTDRMPALYIGHGAPPLLDDPVWSGQLAAWARDLPRPKAILIVSAHWESAPVSLTANHAPLVYDFGGFAPRYYQMQYETPDSSALAQRIAAMMPANEPVHQHASRGLDHGAWVPLKIMFPKGDIPVLQMSLPTSDPVKLMKLGERLKPLRDEGVLIIGSGFLTHGLPFLKDFSIEAEGSRAGRRTSTPGPARRWLVATSTRWRRTRPRRPACRTRTRPWSTTRRCSSRSARRRPPTSPASR